MHTFTTTLAVALLAGQVATAAYIPIRRGKIITDAGDAAYTSTHFRYQPESTPASFIYDPPEFSSSYEPTVTKYSYDPTVTHYTYAPKFTYDPTRLARFPSQHDKRVDVGPINPINGLPIPTDLPQLTQSIGSIPVASASIDRSKPEPPNPTAIPSAFALQPGITIQPLTQSVVSGYTTLVPISSSKRRDSTTLSTRTIRRTQTKTVTSFDLQWTKTPSAGPSKHYTKTVTVTVTPSPSPSSVAILTASSSHSKTTSSAVNSSSTSNRSSVASSSSSKASAGGMIGSSKSFEFPYPGNTEPTSTAKPKKECVYPIPGAECP